MDLAIVPAAAADSKEPASHLLSRPDLGHGAVPPWIQVDAKCLLMGILADAHWTRSPQEPRLRACLSEPLDLRAMTSYLAWATAGALIAMRLLRLRCSTACSPCELFVTAGRLLESVPDPGHAAPSDLDSSERVQFKAE